MVHTTGVAAGTLLYWSLGGANITDNDFATGGLTGEGTVITDASGKGMLSLSHRIANDVLTEGIETLEIRLFSDSARTKQLGTTTKVSIRDTSLTQKPVALTPTYAVVAEAAVLSEGQALKATVTTKNVQKGTKLYWSLAGTGITAADLSNGAVTGVGSVDSQGTFSISSTISNDLKTEGAEKLEIKLFTNAARTKQVGKSAVVQIIDTSLTPQPAPKTPIYQIKASATRLNEGQILTTAVQTTNVAAGTSLYWSASGNKIDSKDFSAGALEGSGMVDSKGLLSFSHTLANDLSTEGDELLQVKLFSDAARTQAIGSTAFVTISDTSITQIGQLPPTYNITSATVTNEGDTLTTTISTQNLPSGADLYWLLSGTGIDNADFSTGTTTGVGTIDAQGKFTLTHVLRDDLKTEGSETLKFSLYTDPGLSVAGQVGSASFVIVDTSISPVVPTYALIPSLTILSEGQGLTTSVATTNVTNGTILYYQFSGDGIDPSDLSVGAIFGQLVIQGGKGSFLHTLNKDLKQEGDETLVIQLYSDKPGGIPIGLPMQITIQDTSQAPVVTTEIFQPQFTPFAVKKWASALPVPSLKVPDYIGDQPDIWGTNFAPQRTPGGQPALYKDVDPTQKVYGGIAPEFYDRTVAGTTTPYYTSGQATSWYSQRESANKQIVVDGANEVVSTQIFGYDGTMPGTTFKTRVGQPVVVRHWNDLPLLAGMPVGLNQREGIHLHGGHNAAHADGYPSFSINQGMYRDYYYANTVPMNKDGNPIMSESPSTMWYHDHGEDLTDLNVVKGLAGFWLAFDDRELDLIKNHVLPGWWKSPAEWNEKEFMDNNSPYDIPLALSDRRFNADGSFFYEGFPIGKDTDGYLGDVMLVNGKSYPYLQVEQTQYRMRMLGAAAARHWHLSVQDENGVMQEHMRIGNDTWLLPHAIKMTDFTISPAQRADVVMDFSRYAPGTVLYLVNTAEQTSGRGPEGKLETIGTTGFSERIMKIVVGAKTTSTPTTVPLAEGTLLRADVPILESEISNRRTFNFHRSNGLWLINQTHYDSHLSNAPMHVGVAEQWTLVNGSGGWWHPIHIHLESHHVKTINGIAPSPTYFPEKQFKSDVTLLGPNTTAVINMKFRTFEGPFAFHCHITAHEDSMMMFNFDPYVPAENPANYKEGDPIPVHRNHTPFPFFSAHHPDELVLAAPTLPTTTGTATAATAAIASASSTISANGAPITLSPTLLSQFGYIAYGTDNGDVIQATSNNSYLNGRNGNDYLRGDNGHDMLVGGAGDDVISGGAGDDLVAGEFGNDMLTGGAGRDGFYYVTADEVSTDVITDFKAGEDFISLHHAIRNTNGADATWTYIAANAFSGAKGEVRFANGLMQCDLDGDKTSDINARLLGITSFDANWLNVPVVAAAI
ncbi:multicopper oxidase domain-containing protein [Cyanobium sp. BA5m-10]|uniref:multicopper oxidase domain-containing protein n=1 Tax=Cyanobium sp. BA5m-10 TaxID=2823705 RepID=UPI0020CC7F22|nr:multicopper oxidase domain-containing protein [Cyanobium sp. BA5m-10]